MYMPSLTAGYHMLVAGSLVPVSSEVVASCGQDHAVQSSAMPSTKPGRKSGAGSVPRTTTVMLRNVPCKYTQSMFLDLLNRHGFRGLYDFVYMPMDFKHGVNNGYAFVNLPIHAHALRLMDTFQGFSGWLPALRSKKVCETAWARPTQGLE